MGKGGIEANKEAVQAVRIISVVITPLLALYALLVAMGIAPSTHFVNAPIAISISLIWVLLSLWYYLEPTDKLHGHITRFVTIHFLALAMFMFVIGFAQPFIVFYVILLVASQLFFGRSGLYASTAALIVAAILDILLRINLQEGVLAENIFAVISVLLLGYSIISIQSAQETKRIALLHSQKREKLQYNRLLTIINNLSDAAFTTDSKGAIVMYNAACLDLLDTNDSLKGKNIGDIFKLTSGQKKRVNLFKALKSVDRTTRRDDLNHTYSDGESIRLELTLAPIRSSFSVSKKSDELNGFIIIARDITKQKSLEEERDEFISVVSHELRTPITIVEGTLSNLDVLVNRAASVDPKVMADNIRTAHTQVLYLAKMVNDLSTLSRAERGVADTPEVIDVKQLLHDMHLRYEADAAKVKLHLNLDLGAKLGSVNVSRLYLEELLQNFITNAIKYTHEGSVTIHAKRTQDTVRLSVSDTGIGISRSDQVKVFEKFYRSEDYRIRETSGTGLGLYVSAKLARKLHTHIELESHLNHGSTFSFELPVE